MRSSETSIGHDRATAHWADGQVARHAPRRGVLRQIHDAQARRLK